MICEVGPSASLSLIVGHFSGRQVGSAILFSRYPPAPLSDSSDWVIAAERHFNGTRGRRGRVGGGRSNVAVIPDSALASETPGRQLEEEEGN